MKKIRGNRFNGRRNDGKERLEGEGKR